MRVLSILLTIGLVACGGADPSAGDLGSTTTLDTNTTTVTGAGTTGDGSGTTTTTVGPGVSSTTTTGPGATTTPGEPGGTQPGSPGSPTTTVGSRDSGLPAPDPTDPEAVWAYVMDSRTSYAEKLPYLDYGDGLEDAINAWQDLGYRYGPLGIQFKTRNKQLQGSGVLFEYQITWNGEQPSAWTWVGVYIGAGRPVIGGSELCRIVRAHDLDCPRTAE